MRTRRWPLAATLVLAAACADTNTVPTAPEGLDGISAVTKKADLGFEVYASKKATDVQTVPRGGVYLAGGGTDQADGMAWLLARGGQRADGGFGDVVVLRTSGTKGYNKYLEKLGANSVTSLVISTREGANSAVVREAIERAEVVFLAGGDQSTYVALWRDTELQRAVNARVAAGYPIGGTSAGLAVLGQYIYAATELSAQSSVVLMNPYDPSVTLQPALFTVPLLANVITDSHARSRDRMGRLLTFLARLQQDGLSAAPRAIGVDEGTGVGIEPNGTTETFGTGAGAWYLEAPATVVRVCVAGQPLTLASVSAQHVSPGSTFDLRSWSGSGTAYTLSVNNGVALGSTGSLY